ncbi:MAG: peptidase M50 [Gammaproteobacteria bacterium RIFCSPHIGHO2_12_FULL_40_19]|nr:MAG: peptidase M50 [Gammaproteobacteria bacterium RIFCSPHIGHO2_12_FULL_40_19]
MGNLHSLIQLICVAAIPLVFAVTLHEAAHGWIASKLGDQTASIQGRVSLNPLRHIDPFGTVILPLMMLALGGFIFGWAKPVPIAWQHLRNPRRDMALVALAGPGANLAMAILWGMIAKISHLIFMNPNLHEMMRSTALFIHLTSQFGIMINCVLLVINIIPIPPLDGSRVISSILSPRLARKYERFEAYGIWIFLALIIFLYLTNTLSIIYGPIYAFINLIQTLFGLPT